MLSLPGHVRFSVSISVCVALWVAVGVTGCPLSKSGEADFGNGSDSVDAGAGSPRPLCMADSECELAASSCCECPTFATNRADPASNACDGVACPNPPVCPANVRAACDQVRHECTVACVAMTCATSCADGYAIDPDTGCLSCACAAPTQAAGCRADTDCVETREDCCGCARGGRDTAVLASERSAYDQGLFCPSNPQCPGLDTCDPADAPRCIQGSCTLTADVRPANACAADGSCPAPMRCVVNQDSAASMYGVGVCVP